MTDAQLPNDPTDVKDVLLRTNESFRQLASEHHEIDERIQQLARLAYLTDQQQFEEIALKKRKLALKDRMAEIMRQPLPRH